MRKPALVVAAIAVLSVAAYLALRPRPTAGEWVEASGVMEATEVDVSALVAGRLSRVLVEEGRYVKRGDLVAELDPKDIEPQVTQARGAVAAAEAGLAQAEAVVAGAALALENARRSYQRSTELRGQFETAQARHRAALAAERQARAALDLVRAGARPEQLSQLRAQVASAQVALDDAQRELARLERLERDGAVSRQQVDLQRSARDGARAGLDAARARLAEAQAGARSEERRQAEAALAQAEANVAAAARSLEAARELYRDRLILKQQLDAAESQHRAAIQARLAAAGQLEAARGALTAAERRLREVRVYAPIDGAVLLKVREAGEIVQPNQPIVRLADLDHMWLKLAVPITDLDRVKLGQEVEVTTDAAPTRVHRGRVAEIAQEAEFTPKNIQTREQRARLVFGVKVTVENPEHELKPGMPADGRIRVGRREDGG